ncbi:MAG TPA: TonB-dependent receptor, partial [Pyrinomonadaceae bacterium]|nr:TonB-dependent receptor [Pyrinomonadaceae bacterium]
TDSQGNYQLIGLPPGEYEVSAEAATFKKSVVSGINLTVGQSADLTIKMEIGETNVVVNVTGDDVQLVETSKSTVSNTIDQQKIVNLPINERSATGFALTLSTVGRDNGRPIGPAPTSGLNVGGQRGRSTQVNVDGADFTDNSINAARTTVSMEAVQEYQVATNSYTAEFGRATGGVVNVVTKRGTNDFRGNVFGFIRDKSIQARNAFAPIANPDFRRTQYGVTFGGPIKKDKTYFFAAFERRQRDESGFFTSDVVGNLTASATIPVIAGVNPIARTFTNLTAAQAAAINTLVASGVAANICAARAYAFFASSGGQTAITGTNPLTSPNDGSVCPAITPITPGVIGGRFLLSGAPVPTGTTGANGLPVAFRALNALQRIFPVTDRSNYFTVRGDHNINDDNQLNLRFGYNTSVITGIQVESQNQSLGQNDFSRTGITDVKDISFNAGLNTTLSGTMANELRFSYGRRNTSFRSQNGEAVAYNIAGTAFIGRELFSPVDRIENRFQAVENFTWIVNRHTLKFGADVNAVRIPLAYFELNFAGLYNFGNFTASNLNAGFAGLPDFTPTQSYGLGLPSTYIQGFGNPNSVIKNTPLAFYAQDSWRATDRLTLNFGVRYDAELTQTIAPVSFRDPLTGISLSSSDILAAQDAMNVQQGFPRDLNNFAPRFG